MTRPTSPTRLALREMFKPLRHPLIVTATNFTGGVSLGWLIWGHAW